MNNIFFTSDPHFNHYNIIKYCNRPFNFIEEMNEKIIENWNSQVKKNDTVYLLGDIMMGKNEEFLNKIIHSLNGSIILIKGNHDYFKNEQYINSGIKEIHNLFEFSFNEYYFVLCHYQMMSWNHSFRGSFHLYGHEHDTFHREYPHDIYYSLKISERKQNVCMDSNNFYLYNIDEIIENLKNKSINN